MFFLTVHVWLPDTSAGSGGFSVVVAFPSVVVMMAVEVVVSFAVVCIFSVDGSIVVVDVSMNVDVDANSVDDANGLLLFTDAIDVGTVVVVKMGGCPLSSSFAVTIANGQRSSQQLRKPGKKCNFTILLLVFEWIKMNG
jgi:hypothetical protein